jgi:hypothetical protein
MEFIDPRMAGYRSNPQEMNLGKSLVGRLRLVVDPNSAKRTPPPRINGATV